MGASDSREGLLTIGEVAHMKGVSVKALRYYDRIGVLKPSYVSPESGYRYYTLRQASFVDLLSYCVSLGIPLGELAEYQVAGGGFDLRAIMERGRRATEERMGELRSALELIAAAEVELKSQVAKQELAGDGDHGLRRYRRTFAPGVALVHPWGKGDVSALALPGRLTELYDEALRLGLSPLWAEGLLRTGGEWQLFLSISEREAPGAATAGLDGSGDAPGGPSDAPDRLADVPGGFCVVSLPEGAMSCASLRMRSARSDFEAALSLADGIPPERPVVLQQIWEPVFDMRWATMELAVPEEPGAPEGPGEPGVPKDPGGPGDPENPGAARAPKDPSVLRRA